MYPTTTNVIPLLGEDNLNQSSVLATFISDTMNSYEKRFGAIPLPQPQSLELKKKIVVYKEQGGIAGFEDLS